jgi:hypothetical protein
MQKLNRLKMVTLVVNVLNIGVAALSFITANAISDLPNPRKVYTFMDPQAKYYLGAAVIILIAALSNIIQAFINLSQSMLKLMTHINVLLNHILCGASFAILSLSAIFLTYFDKSIPDWTIMGDEYNFYFKCIIAQCIFVPIIMIPTIIINNKYSREKLSILYSGANNEEANEPFIKS